MRSVYGAIPSGRVVPVGGDALHQAVICGGVGGGCARGLAGRRVLGVPPL